MDYPCMPRQRRDPALMQALLARKANEGLTYQQLADDSGIPMSTLAACGRRQGMKTAEKEGGFVEVLVADDHVRSTIWLETRTGLKIHIAPDFDAATLSRLLRTLPC